MPKLLLVIIIPMIISFKTLAQKDYLKFESPSDNFYDVSVPSYKGLPLFNTSLDIIGLKSYAMMVEMNLMKEVYQKIDREKPSYQISGYNYLSKRPNELTEDERKTYQVSNLAQMHLCILANTLLNKAGKVKYLNMNYDLDQKDHQTSDKVVDKLISHKWKVKNGNEFKILESYQKFVNDNLDLLQNWSSDFPQEAYILVNEELGKYNFDKGGFSISVSPTYFSNKMEFFPVKDFEIWLHPESGNVQSFQTMLLFSPENAEKFLNERSNNRKVILLVKIEFNDVNLNRIGNPLNRTHVKFNISNPVIQVFVDDISSKNNIGSFIIKNPK